MAHEHSLPLHAQEWIKGRPDIMLTMPLWTWSEMEVLRMALYDDKVGPAWSCFGCGERAHQDC